MGHSTRCSIGDGKEFPGLVTLMRQFLDGADVDVDTRCTIAQYLTFIQVDIVFEFHCVRMYTENIIEESVRGDTNSSVLDAQPCAWPSWVQEGFSREWQDHLWPYQQGMISWESGGMVSSPSPRWTKYRRDKGIVRSCWDVSGKRQPLSPDVHVTLKSWKNIFQIEDWPKNPVGRTQGRRRAYYELGKTKTLVLSCDTTG